MTPRSACSKRNDRLHNSKEMILMKLNKANNHGLTRYRKKQQRQITGNIIAKGIFTYYHVGITKLNHFVPIHRTKSMEYMITADLGGPTGQK